MTTAEIFDHVNKLVLAEIEKGNAFWKKSWATIEQEDGSMIGSPSNYITKKAYKGINAFILGITPFTNPYFLTFNQVVSLKGQVKKGEKGLPVVFWKPLEETKATEGEEDKKTKYILKYYTVFNIEQTTISLPYEVQKEKPIVSKIQKIDSCESIIKNFKDCPKIEGKNKKENFYIPSLDVVNIVPRHLFENANAFYSVTFHELIHSTGHKKRLNREGIAERSTFGSKRYSFEELVAELGASYLNQIAQIQTPELVTNSAAYIKGWANKLSEDNKFFYKAARDAERAANYILGIYP